MIDSQRKRKRTWKLKRKKHVGWLWEVATKAWQTLLRLNLLYGNVSTELKMTTDVYGQFSLNTGRYGTLWVDINRGTLREYLKQNG